MTPTEQNGRISKQSRRQSAASGYRGAPIEDPTRTDSYGRPQILGVKLEIHPEQAEVVTRIFADYAAGDSITTIAKRLNAEGVTSPAPYRGQRHPS